MSTFLFVHSRKTLFWFSWNFLLIEFLADKSFLFFTKLLVTFSLCFSSANFAFKVTCFMFLYHFFNFTFIVSWCLVTGVLLFWQWIVTDIYEILLLILLICCSWMISHLGFICFFGWRFFSFKLLFFSNITKMAQYWMTLIFHRSWECNYFYWMIQLYNLISAIHS